VIERLTSAFEAMRRLRARGVRGFKQRLRKNVALERKLMVDEKAKRRVEGRFDRSVPVIFADGQRWEVPLPSLTIRPHFKNGRATHATSFLSYGDDVDALVEAIGAATDPSAVICGTATLAAELLRANYDLTEGELDTLLALAPGSEDPRYQWPAAVMEVVAVKPREARPPAG
jgi:hypothetical protein